MPALVSVTASGSSAPSPRVVIVGAAGFTNLGDDAILRAMLAELRGVLPGPAFIVAGGPHPVAEPGIEWIHVRDIRAVDAAIARSDLVIVGGGGFIYDYDAILTPRDYFRGDITFMYPYFRAAQAASARGVPLYFYAVGVDSLVTPVGRAFARDVLSLASAITVRDEPSPPEVRRAGVDPALVEVTADPAVTAGTAADEWRERPLGRVVVFVTRPWLRWAGTWTPSASAALRHIRWLARVRGRSRRRSLGRDARVPPRRKRYNDDDLETAAEVVARMSAWWASAARPRGHGR